jgi:integrase
MANERITKTVVDKMALPETGQVFVWDTKTIGFGVRLTPGGKSYFVQGRVNGKTRRVTIGKHGVFTTKQAEDRAKDLLRDMDNGIDPVQQKKLQTATQITLKEAAENYKRDKKTSKGHSLKDSTKKDIDKHINKTFKKWQDLPVIAINEDMVHNVYKKAAKSSVAQANQAFRIFRAIYNWTKEKSRTKDTFPENPVKTLKGEWGHVPARNGKIPADKFGIAWNYINEQRESPWQTTSSRTGADLILFLLVTGARFTEGAALPWANVNLDESWWELPDPKNRNPVKLPLSFVAKDILENRSKESDFVFPGTGKKGYYGDLRSPMQKLSEHIKEKITPHDLRRSFILAAGQAGVEYVKCKLLMNHKLTGDVTVNNYLDTEDMRWLSGDAEKISEWMIQQGKIAAAGNVVDIGTRRKQA